jgi:hypothetical protein
VFPGFSKTQYMSLFLFIWTTYFGQLAIIRSYLQNLEWGVYSAVPYHMNVICSPTSYECYLQSHITWMLFAVPYHMNVICSPISHECYL